MSAPTLGRGLSDAIVALAKQLGDLALAEQQEMDELRELAEEAQDMPLIVAVLGHEGHGKSTLLNALVGKTVLPTSRTAACTAVPIWIRYSNNPQPTWEVVLNNGLRIAASYEEFCEYVLDKANPSNGKGVVAALVRIQCEFLKAGLQLVDLPGGGGVSLAMHHNLRAFFETHRARAMLVLMDRGAYGTLNGLVNEIGLGDRSVAIVWNEELDDAQVTDEEEVRTDLARYLHIDEGGLTEEDIYILNAKHLLNATTVGAKAARRKHTREAERLRKALGSFAADQEDEFHERLSRALNGPMETIRARRQWLAQASRAWAKAQPGTVTSDAGVGQVLRTFEAAAHLTYLLGPLHKATEELKCRMAKRHPEIAEVAKNVSEEIRRLTEKGLHEIRQAGKDSATFFAFGDGEACYRLIRDAIERTNEALKAVQSRANKRVGILTTVIAKEIDEDFRALCRNTPLVPSENPHQAGPWRLGLHMFDLPPNPEGSEQFFPLDYAARMMDQYVRTLERLVKSASQDLFAIQESLGSGLAEGVEREVAHLKAQAVALVQNPHAREITDTRLEQLEGSMERITTAGHYSRASDTEECRRSATTL